MLRTTLRIMAAVAFGYAIPCVDARPGLPDVEPIEGPLPLYDAAGMQMRDPRPTDIFPPLRVLLSRDRYWAADGHLDVIVQLDPAAGGGEGSHLHIRILADDARELAAWTLDPPAPRFVVYPAIPEALAEGGRGSIEITWTREGRTPDMERLPFRVEREPRPFALPGAIPLRVPNETGVTARAVPVTVGIPFPRGALDSGDRLRLRTADTEDPVEIPIQVKETARWSRHGPVKWVLCRFSIDLFGEDRELRLEYGPGVTRTERDPIPVETGAGFPRIDADLLRFDNGVWFDPGTGDPVRVLNAAALHGAFVEHEDGRIYRMPAAGDYEIEEAGPEQVVLRREGWYRESGPEGPDASTGTRTFCRYVTRYIIHRDSPVLRILHTWIFTGDGNRDRIRNMGWAFPLDGGLAPGGFLASFDGADGWMPGDRLLQHDYDRFELVAGAAVQDRPGGRAPGAARAEGNGIRLHFGVKDFWQNYPSELEFRDGALWFHNWPRHNKPARYSFSGDLATTSGEPALPSAARHERYEPGRLTRSEWKLNLLQARFAHEGEVLDFRLPDEAAENPIWRRSSANRSGSTYWAEGQPESANAQGIARTEEMWLYLAPAGTDETEAARVLQGFNDETLRAVVDPAWVAASGAFYEMHPRDPENYPEEERIYEEIALSPARIAEHLGMYGMWIHGDLPLWHPNLESREPSLYRAFRKRHHGWPYSWKPYARSGDSRLFRIAEASTRQMIDANWCHFVSEDVARRVGPLFHRREGILHRSTLPWATRRGATTRCYESQSDYLWRAWYLGGCRRSRDIVRAWAELTKQEENIGGRGPVRTVPNRGSITLLKSYLETWEATFDPWFLAAAHALSEGHVQQFREGTWRGRLWETGDREFLRFTGNEGAFRAYYMAYVETAVNEREPDTINRRKPQFPPKAFAWSLTGDDYYLRRIVNGLEFGTAMVRDGAEPEYYRGYIRRGSTGYTLFTPYYLRWFPVALWALESAGRRPDSLPNLVAVYPDPAGHPGHGHELTLALRKAPGEPLPLTLGAFVLGRRPAEEREFADYSVTGPAGETVLSGAWQIRQRMRIEVPADAPGGTYRLHVRYRQGVQRLEFDIPVSDGDIPEVIEIVAGEPMLRIFSGQYREASQGNFTFFVPEGLDGFQIRFPAYSGAIVWGPDGERAWAQSDRYGDEEGYGRADIAVRPGQDGQPWRITLASGRFQMDPRIPPYYAVNRTRWFTPDPASHPPAALRDSERRADTRQEGLAE